MINVRNEVADPVIKDIRSLLPKSLPLNAAFKKHEAEIRDIIYQLYTSAYEDGDADGYDRGYDDASELAADA